MESMIIFDYGYLSSKGGYRIHFVLLYFIRCCIVIFPYSHKKNKN